MSVRRREAALLIPSNGSARGKAWLRPKAPMHPETPMASREGPSAPRNLPPASRRSSVEGVRAPSNTAPWRHGGSRWKAWLHRRLECTLIPPHGVMEGLGGRRICTLKHGSMTWKSSAEGIEGAHAPSDDPDTASQKHWRWHPLSLWFPSPERAPLGRSVSGGTHKGALARLRRSAWPDLQHGG